jgi:hypothetical protein
MAEEPRVPKVMALRCTLPVMLGWDLGFERLIVPLNCEPDCFQCRVNVPR